MQYRRDKRSGNELSVLGFGCMRFPRAVGSVDLRRAERLVADAAAGGINYFDTAYIYPGSEEALGAALERNGLRGRVFIATKLPLVMVRGPEDFDRFFRKQLERLRTDYVDYYLMHMLTDSASWERLRAWGIEGWIEGKKREGRIRQAGFSFHGSREEFFALTDAYDWDFCQIQYNYSGENYQAGTAGLKKAAERMPVMVMEPLLGGKLAGGLPPRGVEIFRGADASRSPAAWGLDWVWDHEEVTVVLSGMGEPAQLEENLRLADRARPGMLREEDREVYRRVLEVLSETYRVRCTGCGYCMPCPRGINIPGCFSAYNASFALGWVEGMKQYLTSTAATSIRPGGARLCVGCGKCEGHCPQHIPVRQSLGAVRRRLDPFWMAAGLSLFRRTLRGKGKTGD